MAKAPLSKVTRKNTRRLVAGKTVAASSAGVATSTISAEDVALRAYLIYLEEGCPEGRHLDHWVRAESELRA